MAPIAIASLAALVGLFALLDSRDGDRRAVLAGLRPGALFCARIGVLAALALSATVVSLAITALVFQPTRWLTYAAANLLLAFTYGLIGTLLAPIFGRVGGVFVAFLLPFLDLGIVQSPMLHTEPTTLSTLLPGYGGSRVLLDGALTSTFDETLPLVVGLAWLGALAVLVGLTYRHTIGPTRSTALPARLVNAVHAAENRARGPARIARASSFPPVSSAGTVLDSRSRAPLGFSGKGGPPAATPTRQRPPPLCSDPSRHSTPASREGTTPPWALARTSWLPAMRLQRTFICITSQPSYTVASMGSDMTGAVR